MRRLERGVSAAEAIRTGGGLWLPLVLALALDALAPLPNAFCFSPPASRLLPPASRLPRAQGVTPLREIIWDDIAPPLQKLLSARGIDRGALPPYIVEARRRNRARLREGDLDHLVYYALQSSAFTDLPRIEPAVSARGLVEGLTAENRARFLAGGDVAGAAIPRAVQARFDAFHTALETHSREARLAYFRDVLAREPASRPSWRTFFFEQYLRAMRFLYEKEFAPRRADQAGVVSTLYQQRGLSTDTSVDAGYVVYLALATLQRLEPQRRIGRVLVVGPGLDVAPRTGLVEAGAPQSYQPFAVMDALVGLGLAEPNRLRLMAIDINPRVTDWLMALRGTRPRLALVSGIAETDRVRLTEDYRAYFAALGRKVGLEELLEVPTSRRLGKSVTLAPWVTDALDASTVDIVADRLDQRYDLVVVTNVFPYLSDPDLLLALTNIVRMLGPGGVLLHNEPRPLLAEAMHALPLPLMQMRSAVIATVKGARSPLYDAVWMHRAGG